MNDIVTSTKRPAKAKKSRTASGFVKVDRVIARHHGIAVALLWDELVRWSRKATASGLEWAFRDQDELYEWSLVTPDQQLRARRKLVALGWIRERHGVHRRLEFMADEKAAQAWKERTIASQAERFSEHETRRLNRQVSDHETRRLSDHETRSLKPVSDHETRSLKKGEGKKKNTLQEELRGNAPECESSPSGKETTEPSAESPMAGPSENGTEAGPSGTTSAPEPGKVSAPEDRTDELTDWFDHWWEHYWPGEDHHAEAWQEFRKINPDAATMETIAAGTQAWVESGAWEKDDGRWRPYPQNFIQNRRWEAKPPTLPKPIDPYIAAVYGEQ